jgi:hypothetical protein
MVAALLQEMYGRVLGKDLVVVATIRLLILWLGTPSRSEVKQQKLNDMIEVVVNLNIIVNHAVLILISIYISDLSNLRRWTTRTAFHLG